jgi:hypothetical protein
MGGNKVTVSAEKIQEMQRGYEMRIARQRDAITRLQNMATDQAAKFAEWMRDEIERTGRIDESDQAPVLTVAGGGVINDEELDSLLLMIPKEWDMYGEQDTARSILAAYINSLKDGIDKSNYKEGHLVGQMNYLLGWIERRTRGLADFSISLNPDGSDPDPTITIKRYVEYLEDALSQAKVDAKNNARQANQAMAKVVVDDETPPWERQSFVQPATVGTDSVFTHEPSPEVSETLSWDGSEKLPPGETRPGSF